MSHAAVAALLQPQVSSVQHELLRRYPALSVFVDRDNIHCADFSNDAAVSRGLLSCRMVHCTLSEHFVCKPWTLFEFFFTSARVDVHGPRRFGLCVDLFNKYELPGSSTGAINSGWLFVVKGLRLPWPDACQGLHGVREADALRARARELGIKAGEPGKNMPPCVLYHGEMVRKANGHIERVVSEIGIVLGKEKTHRRAAAAPVRLSCDQ